MARANQRGIAEALTPLSALLMPDAVAAMACVVFLADWLRVRTRRARVDERDSHWQSVGSTDRKSTCLLASKTASERESECEARTRD